MKKTIILFPLILGFMTLTAVPMSQPLATYAEGEVSSTAVSSEVVSVESSKGGLGEIVIDGKTLDDWKKELKDESTRNNAIFTLALIVAFVTFYTLKWLSERKLLNKTNAISTLANLNTVDLKKKIDEYDEKLKAYEKELSNASLEAVTAYEKGKAELQEKLDQANALLEKSNSNYKAVIGSLLEVVKADPNQVGAGTYKRIKEILEASENAEE